MHKLPSTIKAIVFDLDDTLYSEAQFVRSGFRSIAQRLVQPGWNVEKIFELLWQTFKNGPRDRVFNTVLKQLGQDDDPQVIAELIGLYRCHRPGLELESPVREMLKRLHKKFKLGLITDGFLPTQKLKVEALQLENIFDHIIYTEELGRQFWKPSPRAFEMMAQKLGCEHQQCVYIADNPVKDFVAPNQLGWQSVQVKRPDRVHTDLIPAADGQTQIVIKNITELATLLR